MLMVVSPAKALDESTKVQTQKHTHAEMLVQASVLAEEMKYLGPNDLSSLMGISEKLSELNYERFQEWQIPFPEDKAKQAAWLFKGDVYQGLDAYSLTDEQIAYTQKHLRILSGLYGLLKPLDNMLPYRLEMGTKFKNSKGKDLYAFWGSEVTELLNEHLQSSGSKTLVNLASNEYFKVIKKKELEGRIVTPVFKDWKGGKYKIISFYAKKARGLMARYAADNTVENAEDLKYFDYEGYEFNPELSSEVEWVFTRNQES